MRSEWPQWQGPRLPAALHAAVGTAEHRYVGKAIAISCTPVFDMFLLKTRPRSPVDDLTRRELQIARHFAAGPTNKEIARAVGLSPATVRNHLSAIYLKLGIGDKAELATLLSVWADD